MSAICLSMIAHRHVDIFTNICFASAITPIMEFEPLIELRDVLLRE